MITGIETSSFRAFENSSIEFRPITLVLGPNNSGKSALISSLALLAQTMRSQDPHVPLLLQGPLHDFGTYRDVVFGNAEGRRLQVRLKTRVDLRRQPIYLRHLLRVPDAVRDAGSFGAVLDVTFMYRPRRREIVVEHLAIESPELGAVLEACYSRHSETVMLETLRGRDFGSDGTCRQRLQLHHFMPGYIGLQLRDDIDRDDMWALRAICLDIERDLNTIEFVGPFREPPARTYLFAGESPVFAGARGEKAVEILAADVSRKGKSSYDIDAKVSAWMARAGIASRVGLDRLTDRHFELKLDHPLTGESQNIADAGYGCSQVFPILVAGYNLVGDPPRSGAMFVVQQPELHLHPRAQAELGTFFLDLAKASCQSVIETHSEHLVVRVQSLVADPEVDLCHDDVAVYYVHAAEGGRKVVRHMPLDEEGTFTEPWPEGFFPEGLEEAKRLVRARRLRAEQGGD